MQKPVKYIELLAPAKDVETGIDAINFGADAVYIGPPKFGARAAAGNTMADIERLINHAHLFQAKVYATINTLLFDHELESANQLIWQLYESGIDAIIIQDLGLLKLDLPPVALHASTQTHNHTVEKVKFIQDLGFDRVVLARELSIAEILAIKEATAIELETFIHGSLCVSYSGQCYLSKCLTNRSANRGECAQPCRSYYDLIDSNNKTIWRNKHLLSLKDLNLSAQIEKLIKAGAQSLKIEGRLKDRAYVRNITAHYRILLDKYFENDPIYQKSSNGHIFFDFSPDPDKTFNRGFTSYFAEGRKKNISTPDTAKSTGEYIGTVESVTKNGFIINSKLPLNNGDGLIAIQPSGTIVGIRANSIQGNRIILFENKGIEPNSRIYRNHNISFHQQILNSSTHRFINIEAEISEKDSMVYLKIYDSNGLIISVSQPSSNEPPKNAEIFAETVKKQLFKTNNTIFRITKIAIIGNLSFIKIAEINALRREALERFSFELHKVARPTVVAKSKKDAKVKNSSFDYKANIINSKAESIYADLGSSSIEKGIDASSNFYDKELMVTKHCIKYELGNCPKEAIQNEVVNIRYPIYLTDNANKYLLEFDCKECVMKIKLSNTP